MEKNVTVAFLSVVLDVRRSLNAGVINLDVRDASKKDMGDPENPNCTRRNVP